jgi:hypothetical protein
VGWDIKRETYGIINLEHFRNLCRSNETGAGLFFGIDTKKMKLKFEKTYDYI